MLSAVSSTSIVPQPNVKAVLEQLHGQRGPLKIIDLEPCNRISRDTMLEQEGTLARLAFNYRPIFVGRYPEHCQNVAILSHSLVSLPGIVHPICLHCLSHVRIQGRLLRNFGPSAHQISEQ